MENEKCLDYSGMCIDGDFVRLNDMHEFLKLLYIIQILLHCRFREKLFI